MATEIALDPAEVADADRVELSLNSGQIRVVPPGPDWGDAEIQAYMADAAIGSTPVDYRIPNRQVKIPLFLGGSSDERGLYPSEGLHPSETLHPRSGDYEVALRNLQAKVALIQREGGWLKRGGNLYADVVEATLTLPDQYSHVGAETDVVLALECLPDFYGDEKAGDTHLITGAGSFTEMIAGDHPCRARLIVTDTSGENQRGIAYAARCRNYDPAPTAAPSFVAGALTPLDRAAVDGTRITHSDVGQGWTPILSTDLAGVGPLTHVGTYQIRAKLSNTYPASTTFPPARVRLLYDVGDFTAPTILDSVLIPASGRDVLDYIVTLGTVRIDRFPVGAHAWRGVIQASFDAGESDLTISVAELYVECVDDAAGTVTAEPSGDIGLAAYELLDEFNQSFGDPLDGQSPDIGDTTWSADSGFTIDVAESRRAAISTTGTESYATLGDPRTLFAASVDLSYTGEPLVQQGLRFRSVSAGSTEARFRLIDGGTLSFNAIVGGVNKTSKTASIPAIGAGETYTLIATVDAAGRYAMWWAPQGQAPQLAFSGYSDLFAAGGDLESGAVGIYDESGTSDTRYYDHFAVWTPTADAAVFGNRTVEIRYDQVLRQAETGAGYGKLVPTGDLLRLPPSGLENRPVEVFVKTSRGDFDEIPDIADDPATVQLRYRPCWLFPR